MIVSSSIFWKLWHFGSGNFSSNWPRTTNPSSSFSVGGGIGVPYDETVQPFLIDDYADLVSRKFSSINCKIFNEFRFENRFEIISPLNEELCK